MGGNGRFLELAQIGKLFRKTVMDLLPFGVVAGPWIGRGGEMSAMLFEFSFESVDDVVEDKLLRVPWRDDAVAIADGEQIERSGWIDLLRLARGRVDGSLG